MGRKLFIPTAQDTRICTLCGKEFDKETIIVADWDLCPECRKLYGGMAYVYCMTCNKVVTRVQPGLSDSGFLVKPGDLLHIKECPNCNPLVQKSVPEEMKEYEKSR